MPKIICPRCGQEGYLVSSKVKGKKYLYVSHKEGKKTIKHYIGPADGYTAVNKLYNLNLTNIMEVDLEDVIASLLDRVEEELEDITNVDEKLKKIWDIENLLELHMKRLKDVEKEEMGKKYGEKEKQPQAGEH